MGRPPKSGPAPSSLHLRSQPGFWRYQFRELMAARGPEPVSSLREYTRLRVRAHPCQMGLGWDGDTGIQKQQSLAQLLVSETGGFPLPSRMDTPRGHESMARPGIREQAPSPVCLVNGPTLLLAWRVLSPSHS